MLRSHAAAPDGPACAAYLQIVLFSLPAVACLSIPVWRFAAIRALLLPYEGFLILVQDRDPSLQLRVELELGAVRLLYGDVLVVKSGERYPLVGLELRRVRWKGENLGHRWLCHLGLCFLLLSLMLLYSPGVKKSVRCCDF